MIVPLLEGVKVTARLHCAPAARPLPHGFVLPGATEYSPLATTLVSASETLWLFAMVIVFGPLVVPTVCGAKVKPAGVIVTSDKPVPETETTCVPMLALSMNAREPLILPAVTGENLTSTVQLALTPSTPPQGVTPLPMTENSEVVAKFVMLTADALAFLTVSVFAADLRPTQVEAKEIVVGEKVNGDVPPPVPVPVRATICVGNPPPEIETAPATAPSALGVNVTDKVQVAFGASVPLQGLVPEPATA